MLIWHEAHSRGDEDPVIAKSITQEDQSDLAAAQSVVRRILSANGIGIDSIRIRPKNLKDGQWLADMNTGWLSPGEEVLSVPDMRSIFSTHQG